VFHAKDWGRFWDTHAEAAMLAAAKIAVIILGYLILRFVLGRIIKTVLGSGLAKLSGEVLRARKARVRALQSVLGSTVSFVLGFVAVIMILQAAGLDIIPLITTASVAGLAIGFGAQKLVRDVISGFFILMEDQYGVGDYVTISGVTGVVEDLQMRTTQIRDTTGRLYILSNGDISQVCNHSRGKLTLSVDYAVAASADIGKAREVLDEVGKSMARDLPKEVKEPFACEGLAQVSAGSNVIRLTGVVSPAAQENVRIELNARVRDALVKAGVALA
jgi:small-conductance mechanosensitive channel